MSKNIGAALNAANIVYDIDDFRDPKLDRLTPIQVTKDGRVFGHLAGWKTEHIGRPGVKPPRGTDYRYFHQGVVPTTEGDLPVGHLTLGTGHAGAGNVTAAAAHYDNTGSQVAQVRVGEDRHGIWFAGRTAPTTDDMQRQMLRRSSLSGDWRKVQGQYELVAALAVNVPGFPIPRTETLVASAADDDALVAAGIVRNGPITFDEVQAMVTAAAADAQQRVDLAIKAERVRQRALPVLDEIVASGRERRRRELVASAHATRRDAMRDRVQAILAAGVDTSGRMPPQLHRYWTKGEGAARWTTNPHPYTALLNALRSEITDMTPDNLKGLAANLYHDVFRKWPGRGKKDGGALTASALPMPAHEAQAWLDDPQTQALLAALPAPGAPVAEVVEELPPAVEETAPRTGGMVALLPADPTSLAVTGGEPETELHLTLVYLGDDLVDTLPEWRTGVQTSVANVLAEYGQAVGAVGVEGTIMGRAAFNEGGDEPCAVYLVEAQGLTALRDKLVAALGDRAPAPTYDAFIPHITAGYGIDSAALYDAVGMPVQFDRVRIAIADEVVDLPISEHVGEALLGEVTDEAPPADAPEFGDPDAWQQQLSAAGTDRKVKTQAGADKYGVSIGDVIGRGVDDAVDTANGVVDRAQADAANLGRSVAEALFGKRPEPKAQDGDGDAPILPAQKIEPKAAPKEVAPAQVVKAPTPSRPRKEDARDYVPQQLPADAPPEARVFDDSAPTEPASTSTDLGDAPTIDTSAPARQDMGAGTDHPMEEDESPAAGADGGQLVEYNSAGEAYYDDGTWTDGTSWSRSPVLPGMGYDGVTMLEDQAPLKGAKGGELVSFDGDRGVAVYDDGTETDGKRWTETTERVVSSAWQAIVAAGQFNEVKHKRDLRGRFARKSTGELAEIRDSKLAEASGQPDDTKRAEAVAEAEVAQEIIDEKRGAARQQERSSYVDAPIDKFADVQMQYRQNAGRDESREDPATIAEENIAWERARSGPNTGDEAPLPQPTPAAQPDALPEPPDWSQVDAEPVVGATDTNALRRQLDALSIESPNGDSWERYETGTEAVFKRDAQAALAAKGLRLTQDDTGYLQVWNESELTSSAWRAITAAGRRR